MQSRYMLYIFVFFCAFYLPNKDSYAESFQRDGFEININCKIRNKKFIAWGDFRNGKKCDEILIQILFQNTESGKTNSVSAKTWDKHNPKFRSVFKAKEDFNYSKAKHHWKVYDFSFQCKNYN